MNLAACCTPCSCCHVSMEMREGQDVAHSDYLGGWQHRQLVNTGSSPPPSSPAHTTVPSRPPRSLPAPLPPLLELVSCQPDSRQGALATARMRVCAASSVAASAGLSVAVLRWKACCPHNSVRLLCSSISAQTKQEQKPKWWRVERIQNNNAES